MKKQPEYKFKQNKNDRRGFIQAIIVMNLFVIVTLLTACNPQKGAFPTVDDTTDGVLKQNEGKTNDECPQLDSKLYQLSQMEDPIPTAEQWGFRVIDGKVFVTLVLADEETEIPEGFDLEVGTRLGDQAQVLASFDELCDLANTDAVIAIRQPIEPVLE